MEEQITIYPTTMNSLNKFYCDDVIMNSENLTLATGYFNQVDLDPELNVILYDDPLCMTYEPNPFIFALPDELLVKILEYLLSDQLHGVPAIINLSMTCSRMYKKNIVSFHFVHLEINRYREEQNYITMTIELSKLEEEEREYQKSVTSLYLQYWETGVSCPENIDPPSPHDYLTEYRKIHRKYGFEPYY